MALNTTLNVIEFLIQELGIFAIGATVVGWVARDLISQYFDKELSKYQSEIDKELNRYQTELEKDKLQFSELHTQRAEITAEMYERFVEFEEDMRRLTDPLSRADEPLIDEKRLEAAAKSEKEFINFYMRKRIYFPPHICDTIEEIHRQMDHAFTNVKIHDTYNSQENESTQVGSLHESWKRVTRDEVPELKSDLEDHFRGLLGVEFEQDSDAAKEAETLKE